jgi:hypothetical protein
MNRKKQDQKGSHRGKSEDKIKKKVREEEVGKMRLYQDERGQKDSRMIHETCANVDQYIHAYIHTYLHTYIHVCIHA